MPRCTVTQDNMSGSIPLYLFAKAPVPGQVKTRLERFIGAQACAELAQMMLEQSARKVAEFWPGRLVLCVSPAVNHPVFANLVEELHCETVVQSGDSLGDRMMNALQQGISQADRAVVMGCDVPQIEKGVLVEAWQGLKDGQDVIGPAMDGGFYLLGTHGLPQSVFGRVVWGGNQVLNQVISQGQAAGIKFKQLDQLRDIDRREDVAWLARQNLGFQRFGQLLQQPVDQLLNPDITNT